MTERTDDKSSRGATPRTDAVARKPECEYYDVVDADFARQLERELATVTAERDRLREAAIPLTKGHNGMRVDFSGLINNTKRAMPRRAKGEAYMLDCLHGHLRQMAEKFYAGQISIVDEFLQLYCLDDKRPQPSTTPATVAAPEARE